MTRRHFLSLAGAATLAAVFPAFLEHVAVADEDVSGERDASLEAYLNEVLVPRYGLCRIWTACTIHGDQLQTMIFEGLYEQLNGVVGARIRDLDGDGEPELVVARLSRDGDGVTAYLHVEVYEKADDGAKLAAAVSYQTRFFASCAHELQCEVFLGASVDGAAATVNVFASAVTERNNYEVIRQLAYNAGSLAPIAVRGLVTAGEICAEYEQEVDCQTTSVGIAGLYSPCEELVEDIMPFSAPGWRVVTEGSREGRTIWLCSDEEAVVIDDYSAFWQARGLPRTSRRFGIEINPSWDGRYTYSAGFAFNGLLGPDDVAELSFNLRLGDDYAQKPVLVLDEGDLIH